MTAAEQARPLRAVPVSDDVEDLQTPLYDLAAEQCTLGAMLLSREVVAEVEAIVKSSSFYRPIHETIFKTIVDLNARGIPVDAVTVAATLADLGKLGQVGGAPYLHDLVSVVPVAAHGPHYARIVADRAILRRLDAAKTGISQLIREGGRAGRSATDLLDLAQQMLADIELDTPSVDGPRPWVDIIPGVIEAVERAGSMGDQIPGVPTGLLDLDQLLNGFQPGQLIVVAARTGMGKTVASIGFAQCAAWLHGLPTAAFCLEMNEVELGLRMVSADSGVPLLALKAGKLSPEDWTKVVKSTGASAEAPMFIDASPNLSLADIRSRARKLHRQHGLKLIVVDYLQLVEAPRGENRQVAVAALSRGLKLLAMELQVPVVAVSQLNRGPEQRTDKRPTKADLRESGAIENDADVIILIHRDDYYDAESPRAGEADLIVDKHRNGPTDTITVASQLHLSRFKSMAFV